MHSVVTLVKEGKLGRKTAAAKGILLSHRRKNNKTSDTFEPGKVFEKHSMATLRIEFFLISSHHHQKEPAQSILYKTSFNSSLHL